MRKKWYWSPYNRYKQRLYPSYTMHTVTLHFVMKYSDFLPIVAIQLNACKSDVEQFSPYHIFAIVRPIKQCVILHHVQIEESNHRQCHRRFITILHTLHRSEKERKRETWYLSGSAGCWLLSFEEKNTQNHQHVWTYAYELYASLNIYFPFSFKAKSFFMIDKNILNCNANYNCTIFIT